MHSTDKPINQLSAADLAAAVERSLFDLFRAMAHIPGAELEEMPHLPSHLASPFNPMFKGVW